MLWDMLFLLLLALAASVADVTGFATYYLASRTPDQMLVLRPKFSDGTLGKLMDWIIRRQEKSKARKEKKLQAELEQKVVQRANSTVKAEQHLRIAYTYLYNLSEKRREGYSRTLPITDGREQAHHRCSRTEPRSFV